MKREPITINESGNIIIQTINPSEIWMNEPELISFFNVIAPTFRAAVRTIYKKGILNPGLVEKRIKQKDGCYENFYNVEMIFANNTYKRTCTSFYSFCYQIFPQSVCRISI